jgi:hypothetical protein
MYKGIVAVGMQHLPEGACRSTEMPTAISGGVETW